MLACGRCMRSGKVIHRFDDEGVVKPRPAPATVGGGEEVVEGYGKIIRNAREKAGVSTAVVAERIKEKENYIKAIEQGRFMPTIPVARKLEKELNIKLANVLINASHCHGVVCGDVDQRTFQAVQKASQNMVPVTVVRKYEGQIGAVVWWIEDAIDENKRRHQELKPDEESADLF